MKFLVTGVAGFIGMYVAKNLLEEGHFVVGMDNINNYYSQKLKYARLSLLEFSENFKFIEMDLSDRIGVADLFSKESFERVIHLGAQAGVRYSIENPMAYIDSNLTGTATILEGCRHNNVEHLVYASSSSVYGMNEKIPFSVDDRVDNPVSLYAATKKSNELMAHTYSHLYGLPTTGLRFFTVYGPWGRPDMAPFLFTDAITKGKPIKVFNDGKMQRDFTYIDDIVEGVLRIQNVIPCNENFEGGQASPYSRVYNIGNNQPVELEYFIECIEASVGKKAVKEYLPMQDGDVIRTFADVSALEKAINFKPATSLELGISQFVEWYNNNQSLLN